MLPLLALLSALVTVVLCLGARRLVPRRIPPGQAGPVPPQPLPAAGGLPPDWPVRLRTMSDGSVCWAWEASSRRLRGRLTVTQHLAITLSRAYLLDELARRDPKGYATWTAGGPDLDADPRRFIRSATPADRWGHQQQNGE